MNSAYNKGKLKIIIANNREEAGLSAAKFGAEALKNLLSLKSEVNVMFSADPSQNAMLREIIKDEDVEWDRINAFQTDEYVRVGLDTDYSCAHYLNMHIYSKVTFKHIFYICCEDDYPALLKKYPIDVVFLGLDENGEIGFNTLQNTKFDDSEVLKTIELSEDMRYQKVREHSFASTDDVPKKAKAVTIPTLFSAEYMICIASGDNKAQAVYDTINASISEKCPSTIMRRHQHATLFLDSDSAKLLNKDVDNN